MLTYELPPEKAHKVYLDHLAQPAANCNRGTFHIGRNDFIKIPQTTEQKYNFFKGREKNVPYFGDLNDAEYDPKDQEIFEKLKEEVKAQGANLSLDKQKR